jgi:hypothetical protein
MLGYNLFLGTMSDFDRSKPRFNVFFSGRVSHVSFVKTHTCTHGKPTPVTAGAGFSGYGCGLPVVFPS